TESQFGAPPAVAFSSEFMPVGISTHIFPCESRLISLNHAYGYKGWVRYTTYAQQFFGQYATPAIQAFIADNNEFGITRYSSIQTSHEYMHLFYQLEQVED